MGTVRLHKFRLHEEFRSRNHVGHHQEPDGIEAHLAGCCDMLCRDIGLGAMRGDADRIDPRFTCMAHILDCSDTRQEQRCKFCMLEFGLHPLQIFDFGMCGESVIERITVQPITM